VIVVIDANLLIVLVNGDERGEAVAAKFAEWIEQEVKLCAPDLVLYEVANGLTRSIATGTFAKEEFENAWNDILALPIAYHFPPNGGRTIEIALSLNRQNAYDAAYLSLTETLNAELWTLDGSLYRNALGKGFAVKLIET